MGVVIHPFLGVGDPDEPEHLDGAGPRGPARQVLVHDSRLGDLIAHREHRIERRHRLLEDHRDLVAADGAQVTGLEGEQVAPFELDEAAGADVTGGLGDQAENGERRDRLAAPRLAHDAERLTRLHLEGDAVDRARRAAALLGDEVGLEVTHAEQGLGHTASLRGSSASRSASPTAFSAITTSEIASPGNVADPQATAILCTPSAIMLPQLGVGEGPPIPRNESPASSSIMWPMPRAPETMIGAAALGRT